MSALEHEWPDEDRRDEALLSALCDVHRAEETPNVTEGQLKVLEALSRGVGAVGASEILGLSAATVTDQAKKARHALRAKNTTHACCEALRRGLIH